jgi:hypothetical protein
MPKAMSFALNYFLCDSGSYRAKNLGFKTCVIVASLTGTGNPNENPEH